jgi:hypothetical protein
MTAPSFPTQPQLGGNDGYGAMSGSTLRRDPYYPAIIYSSGNPPPPERVYFIAAHQVNVSQSNPAIYLPQMNATPGDDWRISCRLTANSIAVAGEIKSNLECQWYNSSNNMIGEDETSFQPWREVLVQDPDGMNSWWQPTLEVTVPTNATKLHVVVKMQFVSPVNSFAVWYVSYEQIV